MPAELLITFGNADQITRAITPPFLHGKREPRIVMVGRSNVGKSSLINALTTSKVAYVSKEPGKTRLVHCYDWRDGGRVLVDLPGYGFAKVPKADREAWAKLIEFYLSADPGIAGACLILDSRHEPSKDDEAALGFLVDHDIAITLVLSKVDQLKRQAERAARTRAFSEWLKSRGIPSEGAVFVSSESGEGLARLKGVLCSPSKS